MEKLRMSGSNDKKKWTIMLYLAGNNDLSDEMVWTLTELFRVRMPKQIAVTVQFDPLAKGSRLYPPQSPVDIDGAFRFEGDPLGPNIEAENPNVLATFIQ